MPKIKDGVRFVSPVQAMAIAAQEVERCFEFYSAECELTGGIEEHEPPSLHPVGGALDFKLNHVTRSQAEAITRRVRERLGDGFDVIAHGEGLKFHLHVEYDPKD